MQFSNPLALALLGLVPIFIWIGLPTQKGKWRREHTFLALRLVLVIGLIFSLAGLELVMRSDNLSVVFLVDLSDSVPPTAHDSAIDYIEQALQGMAPEDQAAIVVFGERSLVERPMSNFHEVGAILSTPGGGQSDLEAAIHLGMALYPPYTARRMIILTDGQISREGAFRAIRAASAAGIEVTSLPLDPGPWPETLLTGLDIPVRVREGEEFDVKITLAASEQTQSGLRVWVAERLIIDDLISLSPGENLFHLELTAPQQGFIPIRAQITPRIDRHYQNNELAGYTFVEGSPQILLVALPAGRPMGPPGEIRPDETSALLGALESAGFQVDTSSPGQLPARLADLAGYEAIFLVDIPARALSERQMQIIHAYVQDLGGGVVAVGGPTSFGLGGYYQTPLEELLPVHMDLKDDLRRPSLAMVFVIDRSGSMAERSGSVTKLDLAKEATIRSVELLQASDHIGVVAFDESASWVVPLRSLGEAEQPISRIASLRSGGGTDILAGLHAMARELPEIPSQTKHVILLTDGGASSNGIPELITRLYSEHGITLTTIGIGRDAAPYLQDLAELGGGRYHFAADPAAIPRIFTEETSLATRAYLVEEDFTPAKVDPSSMLDGIAAFPELHGYVATQAKAASRVALISSRADPILASWQYGLGRAVAFTSDATGRWARSWLEWDGFATFWAQVVRYTGGGVPLETLEMAIEEDRELARVSLDARRQDGNFWNDLELESKIVAPDGSTTTMTLVQTAPGLYEGEFIPREEGVYLISLEERGDGTSTDRLSFRQGWVRTYSREYIPGSGEAFIHALHAAGGSLAPENPTEIFSHNLQAPAATRPAWPFVLTILTLLLPLDIALRRLSIGRQDLHRLMGLIREWLTLRRVEVSSIQTDQRRSEKLLQVRKRIRESTSIREEETGIVIVEQPENIQFAESSSVVTDGAEPFVQPATETDEPHPQSTAARLLAGKRARQGQKE